MFYRTGLHVLVRLAFLLSHGVQFCLACRYCYCSITIAWSYLFNRMISLFCKIARFACSCSITCRWMFLFECMVFLVRVLSHVDTFHCMLFLVRALSHAVTSFCSPACCYKFMFYRTLLHVLVLLMLCFLVTSQGVACVCSGCNSVHAVVCSVLVGPLVLVRVVQSPLHCSCFVTVLVCSHHLNLHAYLTHTHCSLPSDELHQQAAAAGAADPAHVLGERAPVPDATLADVETAVRRAEGRRPLYLRKPAREYSRTPWYAQCSCVLGGAAILRFYPATVSKKSIFLHLA